MEPLLEKGHPVWLDNFYSSPALARLLKHKGTVCVGTLKINRKGVHKAIKDAETKTGRNYCPALWASDCNEVV
jgi:hypothetical protein